MEPAITTSIYIYIGDRDATANIVSGSFAIAVYLSNVISTNKINGVHIYFISSIHIPGMSNNFL